LADASKFKIVQASESNQSETLVDGFSDVTFVHNVGGAPLNQRVQQFSLTNVQLIQAENAQDGIM